MKRAGLVAFALMIVMIFNGCSDGYQGVDFADLWGNSPENVNRSSGMAQNEKFLYLSTQEGLVEIDRSTGEVMTLPDVVTSFDYVNVVGEYLFYSPGMGDLHEPFGFSVASFDGRFFKELSSSVLYPALVYDGWAYGLTSKGGELRRVELKSSRTEVLAQKPVEEFFVTEKSLFYTDGKNLYQISPNGGSPQAILENVSLYSLTLDEKNRKLYFVDTSQTEKGISVLELDTLSYSRINVLSAMWVYHWEDEFLLVQGENQRLFFLNLSTGAQETVAPFAESFSVFENIIYYKDEKGNLMEYSKRTNKLKTIYKNE